MRVFSITALLLLWLLPSAASGSWGVGGCGPEFGGYYSQSYSGSYQPQSYYVEDSSDYRVVSQTPSKVVSQTPSRKTSATRQRTPPPARVRHYTRCWNFEMKKVATPEKNSDTAEMVAVK